MDRDHPSLEELEGFLLNRLDSARARAVTLHLIRGCEACSLVVFPQLFAATNSAPSAAHQADYDEPIDRALATLDLWGSTDRTPEERKEAALNLLAFQGLLGIAESPQDIAGTPLFEALLDQSWALRHDDPIMMVQLAYAATLQAIHMDELEIGPMEVWNFRCRAWTELANAYRVADDLDQADYALSQAIEALHKGNQDDLIGARFFLVFACQQGARRRFGLACKTLKVVADVYRRLGEDSLAAKAEITRNIYLGYGGDPETAVKGLQNSMGSLIPEHDSALILSSMQAQIRFLTDSEKFDQALATLEKLRQRSIDPGGRINVLKLRWLEGHIQTGLGNLELAEQALQEVKTGFEEAGLGYKAALAGLELGSVWFQQGDFARAEEMVLDCADVFIALGIGRELMASLLLVRKAAESRYLSLGSLQKMIDALHKEERSPRATPQEEA